MSTSIPYGRRISDLAAGRPSRPAVVFVPQHRGPVVLAWRELDETSSQCAARLHAAGARQGAWVCVALDNSLDHLHWTIGAWKLGCGVLPLPARSPAAERDAILRRMEPAVVVADWTSARWQVLHPDELDAARALPAHPRSAVVASPGRAIASGGSTGVPKIVVRTGPWAFRPGEAFEVIRRKLGWSSSDVHVVAGPLYHMNPFSMAYLGLFEGQVVVLMERFDAGRFVEVVREERVTISTIVPTMMYRILQLADIRSSDFATVSTLCHGGASCDRTVRAGWIELLGPDRLYEIYGCTEMPGLSSIRADRWLRRPGTVGRPPDAAIVVRRDDGGRAAAGEIGEIFVRRDGCHPGFTYVGSDVRRDEHGFVSVGDLGWVDPDGFLFIADRRRDLIISGGANVFPAEVEAALRGHAGVVDVVVVPRMHADWGQVVHAVVEPADPRRPPPQSELDAICRRQLSPYKIPKSYEFVARLPRTEMGKIRRSLFAGTGIEQEPVR